MIDVLYVLGWDVGGWMGKNNSFVLIKVNRTSGKLNWFYNDSNYQIKQDNLFDLTDIFNDLTNETIKSNLDIVLAIDAPLTFPKQFIKFLNNNGEYIKKPKLEIFNPLAYRETDRYIYKNYGKKPLSASFDRLGNNTTVAISHLRYWPNYHTIEINNLEFNEDKINAIESYPALLKPGKYKQAFSEIHKLIPVNIKEGTDQYDAALCSLMAVQFGFNNNYDDLPSLVFPPAERQIYKDEGWIYHFALENIHK